MAIATPLSRATALVSETEGPAAPARAPRGAQSRAIRGAVITAKRRVDELLRQRDLTTEEADMHKANLDAMLIAPVTPALVQRARDLPKLIRTLRDRAAAARSTHGHRLITGFEIRPPVIRVGEREAARISFFLSGRPRSVTAFVLSSEMQEGTSFRFFKWREGKPGYHVAIWDGTFDGSRNRPPLPATYRIRVMVSGDRGESEQVFDQVRVENAGGVTVMPRTYSGVALSKLTFNGSRAVLTDGLGNQISMRAVSGLKPNNPHNPDRRDYTKPRYQFLKDRGPLPAGTYWVVANEVQHPELKRGRLVYPTGGTAHGWGPIRLPLYPRKVRNRSGFFLHLDVTDDGTAGCIGIHPTEEGKFNQMMSLISRNPAGRLIVEVAYP
jgi:hypothetical protein